MKTEDSFYPFSGIYWMPLSDHNTFRQYVPRLYEHYVVSYKFEKQFCVKNWDAKTSKAILATPQKLTGPMVSAVIKQVGTVVIKSNIEIKWNEHPELFVFKDAIFDIKTLTMVEPQQQRHFSQGYVMKKKKVESVDNIAAATSFIDFSFK